MSDLISRSEVIDILCNLHIDNIAVNDKRVTEYIKELPTVEAEPVVHGEWKLYEEEGNAWQCSVCGNVWFLAYDTPQENCMNFCPNCGADMREKV